MNSTLQCLAQTPILVSFFVSRRFCADLNESNPLGARGRLAADFGALLQEMWSPQPVRSLAPAALKSTLGAFAPAFAGYAQHDSQELLAVLLDGLHEDLNRVRRKPAYVAAPDCAADDAHAVASAAQAAWQVCVCAEFSKNIVFACYLPPRWRVMSVLVPCREVSYNVFLVTGTRFYSISLLPSSLFIHVALCPRSPVLPFAATALSAVASCAQHVDRGRAPPRPAPVDAALSVAALPPLLGHL